MDLVNSILLSLSKSVTGLNGLKVLLVGDDDTVPNENKKIISVKVFPTIKH